MFLLQFKVSSKVTLSKLDDEIIQFNCLHRFTLRGLCQESKIDSHFIGNFQHFIAGKKRFVSYLCVLFFIKTLLYVCVCIKGFMFPYNNILVSSRPKSTLHIFSKIKIDSQEKFAHYCFHWPPPLALILTWTQKSAILGHAVIAACKISSRNVSNEACQSQFKPLMFLAVPVIVPR